MFWRCAKAALTCFNHSAGTKGRFVFEWNLTVSLPGRCQTDTLSDSRRVKSHLSKCFQQHIYSVTLLLYNHSAGTKGIYLYCPSWQRYKCINNICRLVFHSLVGVMCCVYCCFYSYVMPVYPSLLSSFIPSELPRMIIFIVTDKEASSEAVVARLYCQG